MRTGRTRVHENGGSTSAVGIGIGIGVAIAIAFGVCGKASLDRLSHDRRLRLRYRYRFRPRRAVVVVHYRSRVIFGAWVRPVRPIQRANSEYQNMPQSPPLDPRSGAGVNGGGVHKGWGTRGSGPLRQRTASQCRRPAARTCAEVRIEPDRSTAGCRIEEACSKGTTDQPPGKKVAPGLCPGPRLNSPQLFRVRIRTICADPSGSCAVLRTFRRSDRMTPGHPCRCWDYRSRFG